MTKSSNKILVGIFLGPHGVRGQVRLGSYTEEPESIFEYEPLTDEKGARTFALTVRGVGKDHYIVSVDGCATREDAERLKGTKLYVDRAALPPEEEGEYYFTDLIGLMVQDANANQVGQVIDVHDYGAGAFLEIKPAQAKSFMLPFKDAFVPTVNIEKGFVEVAIPEGWLSEEKPPKEKADSSPASGEGKKRGHE